ncbi:MAG: AIPR family protein [Clostridium sp.]|nr:AIPR family protein [Clostridium sp.]
MGTYQNMMYSKLNSYCNNNSISNKDLGFMQYVNELLYRGDASDSDDSIINDSIVDGQCDKQIDLIQIEDDDIITIRIIQCKKTEGFSSNIVILLKNGLDWLFNRSIEEIDTLKNIQFRDRILEVRDTINNNRLSNIYIDVSYITLGNKEDIKDGDEILAEIESIKSTYCSIFEHFRFELYGAKELLQYINLRNKKEINKKFSIIYDSNVPSVIESRYDHIKSLVCTISAKELIKIFDDQESEYLFEQNVRKYLDDKSKVNKNIIEAAEGDDSEYFWALNNGVTIICDKYTFAPIGGNATVDMENLQIINGCQTSMALYAARNLKDNTRLLLRIHETKDPDIIEKIILSTNNQNPINPRDLVSNSPEQIKLQQYFDEIYGLKYQRKRNDFIDLNGNHINKKLIVSNDKVGQAALACIKALPNVALSSKGKVFSTENDIFKKNPDKIALAYFIYEEVVQFSKMDAIKKDSKIFSLVKFGRYHISSLIYKKYEKNVSIDFNRDIYCKRIDLSKDILESIDLIKNILLDDDKFNLLAYFKSSDNSKKIVKLALE